MTKRDCHSRIFMVVILSICLIVESIRSAIDGYYVGLIFIIPILAAAIISIKKLIAISKSSAD